MSKTEILIADGNMGRGRRVANALEAAGHICEVVPQGAAALEVALAEHPRVLVVQADIALVDAGKLAEILRANPKTRATRFLFLSAGSGSELRAGIGDARLDPGADVDAILDAVTNLLDRQARVEDLEGRAMTDLEFSGALSELGPAELLQMLYLRGATGQLTLDPDGEEQSAVIGEVSFHEGEIIAAEIGVIRGEKSLFRMLDWRSGSFAFVPGGIEGGADITTPTRSVLAEGLRQLDEWNRLAPKLPPFESPVRLCVDRGELPQLVHPLTQEVLGLLEDFERVGDVVDHCSAPDYQVLRTLHTLSERGIAEFGRAHIAPSEPIDMSALFSESQIRRLRTFAQSGLAREAAAPDSKLLVVSASPTSLERFVSLLTKIPGVELAPHYERGQVASDVLERIARIDVDGAFGVDLIHLPASEAYEAVCDLAGHRALGTLILLDAGVSASASGVSSIAQMLASRPDARSFNVVMIGEGERIEPDELQSNLSLFDQASLFLLPVESSKDPGSLLRSLFARIVP
jgi:CheY-like chemotaxis protein